MAKKPTTPAKAQISTPGLQKALDIITSLKPQVDEIGNACLQIMIIDESTLSVGQQNLSKANSIVKSIEEKRKEAKAPILEAGKTIDKTCADLTETIEKGIGHIKSQIAAWEKKRIEEEQKKQAEIAAKEAEAKEKIATEERRKKSITDFISNTLTPYLQNTYEGLTSPEKCDEFLDYIDKRFPGVEKFQEYLNEANQIRDNYKELIRNKKQQLLAANSMSVAEVELLAEKERIAKAKQELAAKELEIKAKEEQAKLDAEKKEAEEKAQMEKETAELASEKTRNVRYTWDFECYNKNEVPMEWLCVDEAKIKEYLKENKDKLNDGQMMNGIRFFKKMSIVS